MEGLGAVRSGPLNAVGTEDRPSHYNTDMPCIELPHTPGCLVCGRDNPLGLKLALFIEDSTGEVHVEFLPRPQHIGFEGIIHGGALATILDEAMVWAATWHGRRFCLCGAM